MLTRRSAVIRSRLQIILDEEVMTRTKGSSSLLLALVLALPGCASTAPAAPAPTAAPAETPAPPPAKPDPNDAYRSTYRPLPSSPVLITNATILTAVGDRIENG